MRALKPLIQRMFETEIIRKKIEMHYPHAKSLPQSCGWTTTVIKHYSILNCKWVDCYISFNIIQPCSNVMSFHIHSHIYVIRYSHSQSPIQLMFILPIQFRLTNIIFHRTKITTKIAIHTPKVRRNDTQFFLAQLNSFHSRYHPSTWHRPIHTNLVW